MNKFAVGDIVVCRVGGPEMIVTSVPFQPQNNNNAFAGQNIALGGNIVVGGNAWNQPVAQGWYMCMWWNSKTGMFNQFNFVEDLLDDAPSK